MMAMSSGSPKIWLRIIGGAGSLFCFMVIYLFSNQDGSQSHELSNGVLDKIAEGMQLVFGKALNNIDTDYWIRKLAHFGIYFILGIFLTIFAMSFSGSFRIKLLSIILVGGLYAITDEIHQKFIPGRTASAKDVLIDSIGVLAGALITFAVIRLMKDQVKS